MNLSIYIARRYLFSKKSHNAINIISLISVSVVAISTSALIIIFSVFNGFDDLIQKMQNNYDPDLKIISRKGKVFSIDSPKFEQLKKLKSIAVFAESLEDNVLVKLEDRQKIAILKGVSKNFNHLNKIDSLIVQGVYSTSSGTQKAGVLGIGLAYALSINIDNYSPISLWIPERIQSTISNPTEMFNRISIVPSGIVSVDQEFDEQYIIIDISSVRELTGRSAKEVSAVELKIVNGDNVEKVKKQISDLLGTNFWVKDRYEQHAFLFKIMHTEKWAVFFILLFVIIIASFSITGSLTMLIIEKKKDIITMKNLGASNRLVSRIFLFEGWLISVIGALFGLILGFIIVILQIKFQIIRFPENGNFIIQAYPVKLLFTDFITTFISVSTIGFFIALIPVRLVKRY